MPERPSLRSLFWTFFKIGLFTFGGGYAMIPLIESVCVEQRAWITHEEMMRVTVIAESTPGPIAINCATFVGNRRRGVSGAAAATIGVVLPSFLVIVGISFFLERFLEITVIANAFRGIRIAVSLLILRAGLRMLRKMEKKPLPLLLFGLSCAAMLAINCFSLRFSTIWLLLIAGLIGFAACLLRERREQEGGGEE